MLGHERLDVYRCSIEFLALSAGIAGSVPRGNSILLEQLKRAALSIPLNIAEGAGKQSIQERKRYYGIARGSAMECGAILDACKVLSLVDAEVLATGKAMLVRIVSMLTKMCK
jgi:four helix bundle protein